MKKTSLGKLTSIVEDLSSRCELVDASFKHNDKHLPSETVKLFSNTWFKGESSYFSYYLEQIKASMKLLTLSTNTNDIERFNYYLERLNNQIIAITNALNSNESRIKGFKVTHKVKVDKAVKQQLGQIMQSSQELYQTLSDYKGFEQRLLDLISEQQTLLTNSRVHSSAKTIQDKMLVLHQRLGKCRKAITEVENAIVRLEKRN